MLKNEKGFTVIELIMSFLFASILALTLFSVIILYRNKQVDSTIEAQLLAFKSQLIIDVQNDIEVRGLKDINYCPGEQENAIIPRCVIMNFNDETSKTFYVKFQTKVDSLDNLDGTTTSFDYYIPYIIYGDIRYDIPDAANVYIDDDYILQTASMYDGLETGTKLYKISFNLKHSDLDTNINISITANGTSSLPALGGEYKSYNIGDEVYIQLNNREQRKFRVIQYSNSYNNMLTLLYDDSYDDSLVLNSTDYNNLENLASRYNNSKIKYNIDRIKSSWNNVEEIRLITSEEISKVASLCPQYKGTDSPDVSLSSAPSWLVNKSYWTMSEKIVSGDNNGKTVWYVNSGAKTMQGALVNANYALRPVIEVNKAYAAN